MGFRFRKSINLGAGFKANLSKSGVGFSWGTKGVRLTRTAKGKNRATVSIPGTGISYSKEFGGKKNTKKKNPEQQNPQDQASETAQGKKIGIGKIVVIAALIVAAVAVFLVVKNADSIFSKKEPASAGEPAVNSASATDGTQGESRDYVLNTSSKRFHLPDCSSAESIKEGNRDTFHGTRDELIAKGYDSCSKCDS